MTFHKGGHYTLAQIRNKTGNIGNPQACMPYRGNTIAYGQFRPDLNFKFPDELWIEKGPYRERSANLWCQSKICLPIFKNENGTYEYMGHFKPIAFHTSKSQISKSTGNLDPREQIAVVIEIEPCMATEGFLK